MLLVLGLAQVPSSGLPWKPHRLHRLHTPLLFQFRTLGFCLFGALERRLQVLELGCEEMRRSLHEEQILELLRGSPPAGTHGSLRRSYPT